MKIIWRLVLVAALAALGVWLWTVFFPSPERAIRHHLIQLAKDVSFSNTTGGWSRLAGAESVAGFFDTNVEVNINVPGHEQHTFTARAEITQAALASRKEVSSLSVRFPDINLTVAPDKTSAIADVTVMVNIAGEQDAIVQELKITFVKSEGQWLIQKIETVRTVS
jgi:hypothetical protein